MEANKLKIKKNIPRATKSHLKIHVYNTISTLKNHIGVEK